MQRRLVPRFGGHRLDQITGGDVEAFRTELLEEGLSKETVRRLTSLLSGVFEHTHQYDRRIENPARAVRRFRPEPKDARPFSQDETDGLWKGCNSTTERALVGFGLFAGLRASELLGLQWRHIDFHASVIHIVQTAGKGAVRTTTKSGRQRRVVLVDQLRHLLLQLFNEAGTTDKDAFLFPGRSSDRLLYQLQEPFKRIKEAGGIQNAPGFHGLRHTFVTRALDRGLPPHQLQTAISAWSYGLPPIP